MTGRKDAPAFTFIYWLVAAVNIAVLTSLHEGHRGPDWPLAAGLSLVALVVYVAGLRAIAAG